MACGSCSKRRDVDKSVSNDVAYDLTGGIDIKSLNTQQIKARLEIFKRRFCTNCSERYDCNYDKYLICQLKLRR